MTKPVFGFLAFTSGSYEGAIIRDMRLANALHRRGFKVVIYWMMETNADLVDRQIPQTILTRAMRYRREKPSEFFNGVGKLLNVFNAQRRRRFAQQHPNFVATLLKNFVSSMCDGDAAADKKLEELMIRDGVTHLLPTFAMTCPLAMAVKARGRHSFDFLPTFQGEEIFANFAQAAGRLEDYYAQLRKCAAASRWPSVVVSNDYALRLESEMGLDKNRMVTIYPGIELPKLDGKKSPFEILKEKMPTLDPKIPIVTYFGRQDSEKGIDLLLYATKILCERGVKLQLVICGGSSFGWSYQDVCQQIAGHLRLTTFWKRRVDDDVRKALYTLSRCVVYPSIHREPFGMVAAETMSYGTPVIVPDHGGIMEVINRDGRWGGLTFKVWDSADLANQMQRLLTDDALHASLAGNARGIAEHFSVEAMTDGVLKHLGVES
jgi:glycosyltransferase involved in cell wall biosynthesis